MDLCRLCYSEVSLHLYRTVFSTDNEPSFLDIIKKLTDINITEHDPYPKVMCLACYNKLMNIIEFRQTVKETDSKFRQSNNITDTCIDQNNSELLEIKQEFCEDDKSDESRIHDDIIETKLDICESTEQFYCATIKEEIHHHHHQDESVDKAESEEDYNLDLSNIKTESSTIVESSQNNGKCKCKVCGRTFKVTSSLVNHLKKTCKRSYKCSMCNQIFPNQSSLFKHKKQHNKDSYKCEFCEKEFTQPQLLRKHKNSHYNQVTTECEICHKVFTRKDSYRKHKYLHIDTTIYRCDFCDEEFTQYLDLREHKLLHSDQVHHCNICGKRFLSRASSIVHIKRHFFPNSHECSVCGEKFRYKSNFLKHISKHTDDGIVDQKATANEQLQASCSGNV